MMYFPGGETDSIETPENMLFARLHSHHTLCSWSLIISINGWGKSGWNRKGSIYTVTDNNASTLIVSIHKKQILI